MYEAFYGFKEKPFSMLPDPDFLFLSKKHQAALTLLEYGMLNHVGFCVISGEPGAGKTTILRALLKSIGDKVTVGLITNTHQSFGGLLDWILSAFNLHQANLSHVEMHQIFMDYLIDEYAKNRTVLLIVDEAQNMSPDALEELRMLSNVNSEKDQLMQVVLAGQPALKETLRRPELMQFAQRIAVDYHLGALNLEETCGYIQHRLVTAGAEKDVFTPAACERIYNYSGGTPRLINLLCETVLVYGFADQEEIIDATLVDEMVQERMKDSVVPIVNRDIAKQVNKEASEQLEKGFPWIQPEGGTEGLKPSVDTDSADTLSNEKLQAMADDIMPDLISLDELDIEAKVDYKPVAEDKKTIDEAAKARLDVLAKQKPKETELNRQKVTEATPPSVQKKNNRPAPASSVTATAPAPAPAPVSAPAQAFTEAEKNILSPAEKIEADKKTHNQLLKYGLIVGILTLVLVALALLLNHQSKATEAVNDDVLELQKQREKEETRLKQVQIEAETLKKERDAALAKIEEDIRTKQQAEKLAAEELAAKKLAAEKLALANKAIEDKRKLEQQKQIAEAKERERRLKQAKAKENAEAEAEAVAEVKRKAAKLAEERRIIKLRLEEKRQLKHQEEARRLELEWLEKQRHALQLSANNEQQRVVKETASVPKKKLEECSGPMARFKAACR